MKNEVEAVRWWRKAAEQENTIAEHNLGVCYANGQGVAQDEVEAVKWYRKAAERNYSQAQYSLGFCYGNGRGVVKDNVQAYKWVFLAAAQGAENAKRVLIPLEGSMSQGQIAEAQKLAREFQPRNAPESGASVSLKGVID